MEKKPSSIEWLVDQFKEYDFWEEDGMYLIKIPSWLLAEKEEKAKAMHKEEIENAFLIRPYTNFACKNKYNSGFEQYYNETFGGEDEN